MEPEEKAQIIGERVNGGDVEYETLHRIPASEDYPWGDEVGFVEVEGWFIAVDFNLGCPPSPKFAIEPGTRGIFPQATEWMITDNDAIDYGLVKDE